MDSPSVFSCPACVDRGGSTDDVKRDLNGLAEHYAAVHMDGFHLYCCPACKKLLVTPWAAAIHMEGCHVGRDTEPTTYTVPVLAIDCGRLWALQHAINEAIRMFVSTQKGVDATEKCDLVERAVQTENDAVTRCTQTTPVQAESEKLVPCSVSLKSVEVAHRTSNTVENRTEQRVFTDLEWFRRKDNLEHCKPTNMALYANVKIEPPEELNVTDQFAQDANDNLIQSVDSCCTPKKGPKVSVQTKILARDELGETSTEKDSLTSRLKARNQLENRAHKSRKHENNNISRTSDTIEDISDLSADVIDESVNNSSVPNPDDNTGQRKRKRGWDVVVADHDSISVPIGPRKRKTLLPGLTDPLYAQFSSDIVTSGGGGISTSLEDSSDILTTNGAESGVSIVKDPYSDTYAVSSMSTITSAVSNEGFSETPVFYPASDQLVTSGYFYNNPHLQNYNERRIHEFKRQNQLISAMIYSSLFGTSDDEPKVAPSGPHSHHIRSRAPLLGDRPGSRAGNISTMLSHGVCDNLEPPPPPPPMIVKQELSAPGSPLSNECVNNDDMDVVVSANSSRPATPNETDNRENASLILSSLEDVRARVKVEPCDDMDDQKEEGQLSDDDECVGSDGTRDELFIDEGELDDNSAREDADFE